MFWKKDKSIKMSLPEEKVLYGVKIIKLPVARYINAVVTLENIPKIFINDIIPKYGSIEKFIAAFHTAKSKAAEDIIVRFIINAPTEFCKAVSELLNIPIERLTNENAKDALSPKELVEIITAFWDMNDMNDFFGSVRKLKTRLTAPKMTENTGFRGGSQSLKA